MKKIIFILSFVLFAIAGWTQSRETRTLSSYDGISAGEAVEVILVKGNEEKAVIEVEGTDARNVETEVSGSTLTIGMKPGNWRNVSAKVTVTYKDLKELDISSAARVRTEQVLETTHLEVDVSSAGSANLEIKVNSLETEISSAGKITVSGMAVNQKVEVSSAGNYDGEDLQCETTEVEVSSAGSARVVASKKIDAHANSGGTIRYKGNPEKEYTDANSGGSVKKMD